MCRNLTDKCDKFLIRKKKKSRQLAAIASTVHGLQINAALGTWQPHWSISIELIFVPIIIIPASPSPTVTVFTTYTI